MDLGARGSARLVAAALGVVFLAVAAWVEIASSFPGDERALVEYNAAFGTTIDDPMVAIGLVTNSLPLHIAALAVVALLLRAGRRHDALIVFVAVALVAVVNPLLKQWFARPRPDIRPSPEEVSTYAFPSGHAANTAALAGALLLATRGTRWFRTAVIAGALIVVIVGFSRLAIGVHYPSDVVGGWLWVGAWIALLWSLTDPGPNPRR